MGPVLAIGIAVTVLAGITLLPAVLAALPKSAFRAGRTSALWPRIGALVRARPGALIAAVLAVLLAGALGNLKGRETLDFAEQFRSTPESVAGLRVMQAKFPPGQSGPVRHRRRPGRCCRRASSSSGPTSPTARISSATRRTASARWSG